MIAYITIGTNDIEAAGKYYDELLGVLGAGRAMESDRFIGWATAPGTPMVAVIKPFDEQPATPGNGMMVSLAAGRNEMVDALHAKAMELGSKDEGAPGDRVEGAFCLGYWRDLEGNKIAAFHAAG